MIRLGLCCKFLREPIKFYSTTATAVLKLNRTDALRKISELCLANAESLQKALTYCAKHHIGCFRVNSKILPLKTHPDAGYEMDELPKMKEIKAQFQRSGIFARSHDLRLTFHPDQFILLSSPKQQVTERSIAELEYHATVATWIGADAINIHGGGAYGNKKEALNRLHKNLKHLSKSLRHRLTLENDDRTYTPSDLLPFCKDEGIPFVYDIHHHRCLPDGRTSKEITEMALTTWNREPIFHISSPRDGWNGFRPLRHHDYINPEDFPGEWKKLNITVEVEAKAKELAVLKLYRYLHQNEYFSKAKA